MRTLMVWCVAATCVVVACGGSDGGGSSGSGGGNDPCPIVTLDSQCVACVQNDCAAQSAAALGPDWGSKQFGGACKDMMGCICACSDSNCASQCDASASIDCEKAKGAFNSCTTQSCQTNCVLL